MHLDIQIPGGSRLNYFHLKSLCFAIQDAK